MKRTLTLLAALLTILRISGQVPVGNWTSHLPYNKSVNLAVTPDRVFSSTGSSVLIYEKHKNELKTLTSIDGLSGTDPGVIAWSEAQETLVIGYMSSEIDLVSGTSIFNLPDISRWPVNVSKRFNRIRAFDRFAFICTSFGIVVIDLERKEIHDTWRPGPGTDYNEVYDIAIGNGKYYAATENGVWLADEDNQGLSYFGNWQLLRTIPGPEDMCNTLLLTGGRLFVNVVAPGTEGDRVYYAGEPSELISHTPGIKNISIDEAYEGFTVTSPGSLDHFSATGTFLGSFTSFGWGSPDLRQGIIEKDYVWFADMNYGLIMKKQQEFSVVSLPGPASTGASSIVSLSGKTIISGGGADDSWNPKERPFMVSVYEDRIFTNLLSAGNFDAVMALIDPRNPDRFFVSSWGDGLFEYIDNRLFNHFDESNSPLTQSGTSGHGIRIGGLAMDRQGNLWMVQSGDPARVLVLKSDGEWVVHPANLPASVAGGMTYSSDGLFWIVLPGGNGIFVIDPGETPLLFSDDKYIRLIVKDSDGNIIPDIYCLTEDLDGNIWAGSDHGPLIYFNSGRMPDNTTPAARVKIPRNDGSGLADFLLGTETVTSISPDGANRMWLATKNSGAWLISTDEPVIIKNYNTANSPIFTDSLASVAVDGKTGEVWFATSGGVISVRETATLGNSGFENVYAFPNPVRRDFSGNVTITGLLRDTDIRITDVSGNLVYKTTSEGGQASWDLSTYNGKRVTTGIYIVFCADSSGRQSAATKILIVGQ